MTEVPLTQGDIIDIGPNESRRELLRRLTQEAVDAGGYGDHGEDPPMNRQNVPDELMDLARCEWCKAEPARASAWNVEDALRAIIATVLTEQEASKATAVYIAEAIWFGDNVVDGRTRLATCLTLDDALAETRKHKIHGAPDLIATPVEESALHGEGGRTWAVHSAGEQPDDEGILWITKERIVLGET